MRISATAGAIWLAGIGDFRAAECDRAGDWLSPQREARAAAAQWTIDFENTFTIATPATMRPTPTNAGVSSA